MSIYARVAPTFPARILGENGIDVDTTGGIATVSFDPGQFPVSADPIGESQTVLVYDPVSGDTERAEASSLFGLNVPIFASKAQAAAATISASIKSLRTQFYDPDYDDPATLVGGANYARISKVDLDVLTGNGLTSEAWFRSQDRAMPDGEVHATNGGYWVLNEAAPIAEQTDSTATALTGYINADVTALPYIKKVRDGWSLLDFINPSQHSAIIDGTTTYDATARVQAAGASGEDITIPRGKFIVEEGFEIKSGREWRGSGRTRSVLYVPDTFDGASDGVIIFGSGEPGPSLFDLGIEFEQDLTETVRANVNQYPPAIYGVGVPRCQIDRVRISRAWDGLDLTGNTGGSYLGRIEVGALNKGLQIDGALDFFHGESWHFWPFGMSGSDLYTNVYSDGATVAAEIGAADGLSVDKISTFRSKVVFTAGPTPLIGRNIGVLQIDGDGAVLVHEGRNTTIGEMYSTKGSGSVPDILVKTGGRLLINRVQRIGDTSTDAIRVEGAFLQIGGGFISQGENDQRAILVSGGRLQLSDVYLSLPAQNRTVPFIECTSGFIAVKGCEAPNDSYTGPVVSITSDNAQHQVVDNNFGTRSLTLPAGAKLGTYGPNNIYETFTPAPSFATNGDHSPTVTQATGNLFRNGRSIKFDITLLFNTNAYATASGTFRIGPLPVLPRVATPVTISQMSKATFTNTTMVYAELTTSGYIEFRVATSAGAVSSWGTTNVPASTSDFIFRLSGEYSI